MKLTGFDGKLAFVTGAGGGIGRQLVLQLRASGSRVVATDLRAPTFEPDELAASCPAAATDSLICRPLDVADSAAVDRLVSQVESEVGEIDFGVNVAGVLARRLVVDTDDVTWRQVFAVNVDGVFHVSRALARAMTPRRQGSIVTVSSNAAGVPRHAMAAYAASKAASTMFTRCLGLELAPLGIRCNIVAPGSTLTPMQTTMWDDADGQQRVIDGTPEVFRCGIPLGKMAAPADVADAVMFLLSDQAGQITMTDLYVDGGATLRG